MQLPQSRRGPPNMSQTNAQTNYQRTPAWNEADPENLPFSKEQNESHKPTRNTSIPVQLWNTKLSTMRNQ